MELRVIDKINLIREHYLCGLHMYSRLRDIGVNKPTAIRICKVLCIKLI